jgi:hypothetical protein
MEATPMTRTQMETALQTGFNWQGRTLSETARAKYLAALTPPRVAFTVEDYCGFEVSGKNGRWFVGAWPTIYTSRQNAMEAVDNCVALRQSLREIA